MKNPRLAAQTFYGLLVLATALTSGYVFRQSAPTLWLSLLAFAAALLALWTFRGYGRAGGFGRANRVDADEYQLAVRARWQARALNAIIALTCATIATTLCLATLADTLSAATLTVGLTMLGLISLYLLTGLAAMPTFGEAAVSAAHWTWALPHHVHDALEPEKAALVWAHDTLHDARVNPSTHPLQAIKTIRAAAPSLGLSDAVELVDALTKRAA